jgi:hypothetical protein
MSHMKHQAIVGSSTKTDSLAFPPSAESETTASPRFELLSVFI